MAIVRRSSARARPAREPRQNSERESREGTQPVSNPANDEPKSSSTNEKKKAKGKSAVKSKAGARTTKGIVIGAATKKQETEGKTKTRAGTRSRLAKHPRGFAVKSSYSLRTGFKGAGVDVASEEPEKATADRKRKGKEKATEVSQDSETDSEEPCKRIKTERNGEADDDGGSDDNSGNGGAAHKNPSSLGVGVLAGK